MKKPESEYRYTGYEILQITKAGINKELGFGCSELAPRR